MAQPSVPTAPAPTGSGGGGGGGSSSSDGAEQIVRDAYRAVLNRAPDSSGLSYWAGQVRNGMSRSQLEANLRNSDEWRRMVVRKAYRDILGRSADSGGLTYWVGQMKANNANEATLRRWISATPEAQNR